MDPLNHSPSCSFLCPQERFEKEKDRKEIKIHREICYYHNIKSSYFISDAEEEKSNHLHYLVCRNKGEGISWCMACDDTMSEGKTYYFCSYCKDGYHKECVESPSVVHSSVHPKHILQLIWFENPRVHCFACIGVISHLSYYCCICDLFFHPICAINSTPLVIENRKRHEHTLHYFPRKSSALVCDVCALVEDSDYLYVCLLCDFIVHKLCVDLPYVIKVSRHNHRLAFTPNLLYKESTDCGVCHAKVEKKYGEYSCTKGCVYAVHSRCAMQSDVCDGKELEGEPEESYENTKMFEEMGDGIIQHESHMCHQLRLEQNFRDENKHCQACRLPFYDDDNVYHCMQYCDFVLHESCAYLPRVKEFMLHLHPLVLELGSTTSWFYCWRCDHSSWGFAYMCPVAECYYTLDTLCASIREPFKHNSHQHPLFITCNSKRRMRCSICQSFDQQPLNCMKCNFVLCFRCATLPANARYGHDEHLLKFSCEWHDDEDANINDGIFLCEICEEYIITKNGFYECKDCGVTLHISCLLGKDPYMKSGESVTCYGETLNLLPNTYSTRPICRYCQKRCPYKIKIETSGGDFLCSFNCFKRVMKGILLRKRTDKNLS